MKKGIKHDCVRWEHRPYIKRFLSAATVILISLTLWTAIASAPSIAGKLPHWMKWGGILTVFGADEEEAGTGSRKSLEMEVNYGYGGYVKYGRFMNVTADITGGDHMFSGWIQVIVPKSKNNAVYRRHILVTARAKESVSITLPVLEDTPYMQVILTDNNGNTILEKEYKLKIGNYEKLAYLGILSDEPVKLDYLKEFGTRVFYLDKDSISSDYRALDLLDVIVINHFDTSKLKTVQLEALDKWVMEGGTLVIGTGEYQKETLAELSGMYSIEMAGTGVSGGITFGLNHDTLQGLKQDMVDYEEERKIFLEMIKDRNEMLKAYGNETIPVDTSIFQKWTKDSIERLQANAINKYLSEVLLKGSSAIVSEDGHNLMQASSYGHGKIQLFSFDMGLDTKNRTTGLAILNEIRKNMSNAKLTQLDEEYYGSYLNYGVFNSMSYTNAKEIPKTGKYIIILAVYICIIGPVTYLILKKFDKRSLTWCMVPLTAVIFTFIVYFAGADTRIDEPYAGYVRLLSFQNRNKVNEELYFSMTAPYNHNYSVSLDNRYDIVELRGNGDSSYLYNYKKKKVYYDNYITAINYSTDKTELEIMDNPAFSPVYYQWNGSYEEADRLTYDIHYAGDKVSGTVTNGFDFDISNAMLTSDGYVIHIGEIKKGETVSLSGKDAVFMTTRDELYNTDIINRVAGGTGDPKENTPLVNRLSNVLYYLTEYNLLDNQHSSCIIGFVKGTTLEQTEKGSLLEDLKKKLKVYGTTAIQLPVEVNYTEGSRIFVPSIDPYVLMSEGYFDKYYQSRYLNSDSMTVKYHLPEEDKVLSFEYLSNRNQDSSSDYLSAFDGSIYFLNVKTGNYDEVFRAGAGSSETEIGNYLTEQNTITIRYSTEMSLKGYQMVLPYISYWKEADSDAGN